MARRSPAVLDGGHRQMRPTFRGMSTLAKVLFAKIAVTILLWAGPLLFLPLSFLERRCRVPDLRPVANFIRLLGMAYVALLVGYAFGYVAERQGHYPDGVVWAGIVSNGGAFLVLLLNRRHWMAWDPWGRILMWASVVATSTITVGLIVFGPLGHA